jgi:hypothetical protein
VEEAVVKDPNLVSRSMMMDGLVRIRSAPRAVLQAKSIVVRKRVVLEAVETVWKVQEMRGTAYSSLGNVV